MSERVGLIGIGLVGTALAELLLDHGCAVVGYDIDAARCDALARLGGEPAPSCQAVADQADRVFLCLFDNQVVREVVEGPGGVLCAAHRPRYIIDTTTGDVPGTIALARSLGENGIGYLDAPISGSSHQIRRRESLVMVGAEPEAFEDCRDLLSILSDKVFHLGLPGNGAKAKLASNLILGLNRLALAEGLVFAERLGLEPAEFLELLRQSPAHSAVMDTKGPRMVCGDFSAQGRLRQHCKDVDLILAHARSLGLDLPFAEVHGRVLKAAIAAGDGDLDNSAVIRELRRRAAPRPVRPVARDRGPKAPEEQVQPLPGGYETGPGL